MANYKKNKMSFFLLTSIIALFFIFKFKLAYYGIPYFAEVDEIAYIKSILFFYSFVSEAPRDLVDPYFAPLVHSIISPIFIAIIKIGKFQNISEFINLIYYNPSLLILSGRLTSNLIVCLSSIFLYLSLKKINCNQYVIIILTLFYLSDFSQIDASYQNGKNALGIFFFNLQVYYFIKLFKKNKIYLNNYLFLIFIFSLSLNINYWCAFPSLYTLGYFYYKENKLKFTKKLFLILISIIIFGFFPILFNKAEFFSLVYDPTGINQYAFKSKNYFDLILVKIKYASINIYEKQFFLIILLIVSLIHQIYLKNKLTNHLIIIMGVPILILLLVKNGMPHFRYFSLLTMTQILIFFPLIKKFYFTKKKIFNCVISIIIFSIIWNNYNLYKFVEKNRNNSILSIVNFLDNKKIINQTYVNTRLNIRENNNSIELNKYLFENKLIDFDNEEYKKNFIIKSNKKIIKNVTNSNIIYSYNGYFSPVSIKINNYEKFFTELKEIGFKYYVIADYGDKIISDELDYLLKNFKLFYRISEENNVIFRREYINFSQLKDSKLFGPKIFLFDLN
jgi:hypothetical protein